jgi:tetratricopeptide (TPR) repeat protein
LSHPSSSAADVVELAAAREQALLWFRRACDVSQFAREAISAAGSLRAATCALRLSTALRLGRDGAGRHVIALASAAYASRLAGQLPHATKLYRQSLALAEDLVGGGSHSESSRRVDDTVADEVAGADADADDGVGHADARLAQLMNALAICLRQQARYREAARLYRRALAIRVAVFGETHVDVAQSHNSLGCLHQDLGAYALAEYHLLLAVSLRERLLGAQHPDVASTLMMCVGVFTWFALQ